MRLIDTHTDDLEKLIRSIIQEELQVHLEKLKEILPEKQEKIYTAQELADKLKVERQSVYRWINKGWLKPVSKNPSRISESGFKDFIKSHQRYAFRNKRIHPELPAWHSKNLF